MEDDDVFQDTEFVRSFSPFTDEDWAGHFVELFKEFPEGSGAVVFSKLPDERQQIIIGKIDNNDLANNFDKLINQKIFITKAVEAIFNSEAGIILCQYGGWQANLAQTAMNHRGSAANGIEDSAATNDDHVGVTADIVFKSLATNPVDDGQIIFDCFTAFDHKGHGCQLNALILMSQKPLTDAIGQF